ncbi:MAG: carboxylating nicotinate-nucleotide diphosphorylase [Pseudohongiellaceae bacterium]
MAPIHPPAESEVVEIVGLALKEDIGDGDITALLIPETTTAVANLVARQDAIICGIPWANEVLRQVDRNAEIIWHTIDGASVSTDQHLAQLKGNARSLLTAERCMLNFLQTLSGTATLSRHYAEMVSHTSVTLLDTRKTLPGLRGAQKYAVRVGGCSNHRMGLYDAYLIKENHIRASGSIHNAIATAKQLKPEAIVEVEIERLDQLEEALDCGVDIVMLDNFTLADLQIAVRLNRKRAKLEASGGITCQNLVVIAESGVDYISLGALTKDCKSVDLSLLFT